MAKRGSGEGSIFRRGSRRGADAAKGSKRPRNDGLWTCTVQTGVDENGRRRRRTLYGRTRAEVQGKLDELRQRIGAASWIDETSQRLGDYLDRWLLDVAGPRIRQGTADAYRQALAPVRRSLAGVALRSLSPMHIQTLLRTMGEAGASARARQQAYTVLRTALRDAVKMRLLGVNPLDAVSRPRAPRPEIKALDAGQARAFLVAAEGDPLEALYSLAVGSGLRLGELCGLRWGDLDLEAGVVHVRRALVESSAGTLTFAEPKTSRSRRAVDLPGFAIAALRRHRARLGALPHPERLVFMSPDGEPLRRSNLRRRSLKPLLKRAGVPEVTFHALRHTSATLALAAGVHAKVVQERLGHSSVTLTLDTYSHTVPTLGREAAARLDTLFRD